MKQTLNRFFLILFLVSTVNGRLHAMSVAEVRPAQQMDAAEIALFAAVKRGKLAVVKACLEGTVFLGAPKINVNVQDKDCRTPIFFAAMNGFKDVAEALLQAGADIEMAGCPHNSTSHKDKDCVSGTALVAAAWLDHAEVVELLVAAKANLNAQDEDGNTPLMFAVGNKNKKMVEFLVTSGAKVNAQGSFSRTPLRIAVEDGSVEMVEVLIQAGAEVNVQGSFDRTPLFVAVDKGYGEIANVLIQAGAEVNVQDSLGTTVLMRAARKGDSKMLKALVHAGAKLDTFDREGYTALGYAAAARDLDSVKLLVKAGADINAHCGNGWTALMFAVGGKRNNRAVIEFLVAHGAEVNAQGFYNKCTPVMCVAEVMAQKVYALGAAQAKAGLDSNEAIYAYLIADKAVAELVADTKAIIELFIKHGADVTKKNRKGGIGEWKVWGGYAYGKDGLGWEAIQYVRPVHHLLKSKDTGDIIAMLEKAAAAQAPLKAPRFFNINPYNAIGAAALVAAGTMWWAGKFAFKR